MEADLEPFLVQYDAVLAESFKRNLLAERQLWALRSWNRHVGEKALSLPLSMEPSDAKEAKEKKAVPEIEQALFTEVQEMSGGAPGKEIPVTALGERKKAGVGQTLLIFFPDFCWSSMEKAAQLGRSARGRRSGKVQPAEFVKFAAQVEPLAKSLKQDAKTTQDNLQQQQGERKRAGGSAPISELYQVSEDYSADLKEAARLAKERIRIFNETLQAFVRTHYPESVDNELYIQP